MLSYKKFLMDARNDCNIKVLQLENENIDDRDVQNITDGLKDTQIITVNLANNQIGSKGLESLAKGLQFTHVTCLDISRNQLGNSGVSWLRLSFMKCQVRILNLGWNNLGNLGVKFLIDALRGTKVTNLELQGNFIKDTGAKNLANFLKYSQITVLRLDKNLITTTGARYISSTLKDTRLTALHLCENQIKDKGAQYLADALERTRITVLDLSSNPIRQRYLEIVGKSLQRNIDLIKISDEFKRLVYKHPQPLVFQLEDLAAGQEKVLDVDKYLAFIKTIVSNPEFVHYLMDSPETDYTEQEISQFIQNVSIQFCEFLAINIELDHEAYVDILKKCEKLELDFVVKDLLLNRGACLIEESRGNVLYPCVYLLLNKYQQPLLGNGRAFKSDKGQVIKYFLEHPELEFVQDAIEILRNS